MDNKIVKVIFKEGWETMYSNDLTKCDYGQVLQIEGITLPDGNVEVHFSLTEHNGEAPISIGTVKDNVITVDIPDFILQKKDVYTDSYQAYAWIYVTDGESGRTIRKIVFTIDTRAKPTTDVPEDQKDKFLQEIRQVMAETKEIAQSVRDDADNGEFDGEKGEKGDAGSIKFVIVTELPTENIDTSAIYLVPIEIETEQNKFQEYVYTDGAWECIGSASVEVNLDDYVKNDDYATDEKYGVARFRQANGIISTNGDAYINDASEKDIDSRATSNRNVIMPRNLDYAVMKALSDSKLEWTDEQKQLARTLLGSVGSNDIATGSKLGLVQAHANYGVMANGNGLLVIASASKPEIDSKTNSFKPITAEKIDYAVKKALSDCKLSGDDVWTEEEKAKALELLGGIPKTQPTQRNYGDGVLIGFGTNGNLVYQNVFGSYVSAYSIPIRDADGILYGNEPTSEKGLANKKYVDAKNDWRYIGKVTTEEDVQSLFMSTDTDGKPFSLKKIRVVFKNMPNSGDFTGWTRVRINSNTWSSHTIGTGVKTSELYGVTDIEIEKIGEHLRVNTLLVSQNKTTAPNVMVNGTATTLAYTFDLTSFTENITNIELYSYQLAIGAGSYVEVWGIDA